MKSFKCLMGVLLSTVLLFGSVYAANTLQVNDNTYAVKGTSILKKGMDAPVSIGHPADSDNDRDCSDCEFDFTPYGSECCDSAWDEFGIDCATLEANYNWDCSGCVCPGDTPAVCGDGECTGDETPDNCPEDCDGSCEAGTVLDCADGDWDCCPESWIGDGYGDCEDQAYGCDLTCYDSDGGDCADPFCGDGACNGDETYDTCPDDCNAPGECADGEVSDCDESGECWTDTWIGDGFCDGYAQQYGADLCCYDNDGGDCTDAECAAQDPFCGDGMCNGDEDEASCPEDCEPSTGTCSDCEYDFTPYGSECCDSAWDEFGINCADLEANYYWDCSGCNCPGDGEPECGDGACNGDETYDTCPEDCNAPGECDPGYVSDCADDDCCPESWIGDGFEDCVDQQYGCDLTCYDNDGGDCPEQCENYTCWDGSCADDPADCPAEPEVTDPSGVCVAGDELYGYPAVTITWDVETVCGDGICNGDEDYMNCPDDCNAPGECADGEVSDCADDDCCPESWIGDGYGDCEDQAYGCDLTCYDNDGGDCVDPFCGDGVCNGDETEATCPEDCESTGTCSDCEFDFTPYGSECCDSAWEEFGINCADLEANYYWDCSGCNCPGDGAAECGDGACNGDETYDTCPEDCNAPGECDTGQIADCDESGECWADSWIGDGYCDGYAQAYGADLCCYDNDGGDCTDAECAAQDPFCGDGMCNGDEDETSCPEDCEPSTGTCSDCEFDFTPYGSECCDTAWEEFGISCFDLEANYNWDCSGCNCPGDAPAECGDGMCNGDETYETCPEDGCLPPGECAEGEVLDCDGSDECWPESWIGDGFPDCEDQQYGADLTCYDNDGGDCGPSLTCEEQGLVECFDGTCAETLEDCDSECPAGTVADCSGDGDCCFDTWIGDGYCDGEDQEYGCNLLCYDGDGGDCDGGRADSAPVKKYNKGETLSISGVHTAVKSSGVTVKPTHPGKQLAVFKTPESKEYQSVTSARMGELLTNTTREVVATVTMEVLEGVNAGYVGSWDTDPSGGIFTVYGFDASDFVCASLQFCDGGACSDSVTGGCVFAGDLSASECAEDEPDCPSEAGSGDVNGDGSSDVLDIVQIVNVILGGEFADDCAAAAADVNGDGSADVLDIVQIVNGILGGRVDVGDATSAKIIRSNGTVTLEANGYIGGVQMTLKHEADFSIELTDNALVADSKTTDNETILVIVAPEGEGLFTHSGDFEITDMIVANSEGRIDVGVPTEFSLSTAYPNPFNPTTSMMLSVPEAGMVSVQVYNLMGQVVATLASGYMDASVYTLTWDASDVSSGMYLVKAEAAGTVTTQKLMLMK